jgi:hypothetical protein
MNVARNQLFTLIKSSQLQLVVKNAVWLFILVINEWAINTN